MKMETRIELTVVIIAALLLGGWLGLRLTSKKPGDGPQTPIVEATGTTPEPGRFPTAESAETPETPAVQTAEKTITEPETTGTGAGTPPLPASAGEVRQVQALLQDEKLFEAREILTGMILKMPEGENRETVRNLLVKINQSLFFSREKSPDSIIYKIQPGDSLSKIATRQQGKDFYFANLIQQINDIRDPKRIRAGKTLKIPRGRFSALVQKRPHRLIVLLNGHYIKEYPVGIGAPGSPTPEQTFTIATKQPKPTWYAPDGNVYKYGHPKNVLGTRWLGFKEKGEYQSYGLHGTDEPESIGKDVSNGCIRMHNRDVEEVFAMLMNGDTVEIVK